MASSAIPGSACIDRASSLHAGSIYIYALSHTLIKYSSYYCVLGLNSVCTIIVLSASLLTVSHSIHYAHIYYQYSRLQYYCYTRSDNKVIIKNNVTAKVLNSTPLIH